MEDFNFNNNSEKFWNIDFQASVDKNFKFDFDIQSINSHIFMEETTKPSEYVDLPRFYFPNCNEEEVNQAKTTCERKANLEEAKNADLFMDLTPSPVEFEVSSQKEVNQDSQSI
mmetsp:Transcript_17988/g.17713  ORF Transcript_17988/g.17713 Transcript_17988/m.17713 type:complete len:114 (-) Transcript_17988:514-855(-)